MAVAAAIPLTAKALAYGRALLGMGTAGAGAARASAASGLMARRAVSQGLRKAGTRLGEAAGPTTADKLMTFTPDLFFGGVTALNTPGDAGDKLIAGGSDAIFGALGGIGLTAAIGPKRLGKYRFMADMGGSMGGAYVGMAVGDNLMRAKDSMSGGKGQTPFERLSEQDRERLEQNLLAQYGLAGRNLTQYDPFLEVNGLA